MRRWVEPLVGLGCAAVLLASAACAPGTSAVVASAAKRAGARPASMPTRSPAAEASAWPTPGFLSSTPGPYQPPSPRPSPTPTPSPLAPLFPTPVPSVVRATASGTFPADDSPVRIAFDARGNAWVACAGGGVTVLAPDGKPVGTYEAGFGPQDIAFDPDGNAWVPAFHDDTLYKLSTDGKIVATTKLGTSPKGIAFDATGNAWVITGGDGKLNKVSKEGTLQVSYDVGGFPDDLAFDPAGNLWVLTDNLPKAGAPNGITALLKVSPAGTILLTVPQPSAQTIAVDPAGHLWVGCGLYDDAGSAVDEGRVMEFDSNGAKLLTAAIPANPNPGGLAVGKDGTVYVSSAAGELLVASAEGTTLARYKVGEEPYGVTIAPDGSVWVANNYGKSVSKVARP